MSEGFGNILRKKRLEIGYSQVELARILGHVGPQFINQIEKGRNKAPVDMIGRICVILKLNRKAVFEHLVKEIISDLKDRFEEGIETQKWADLL